MTVIGSVTYSTGVPIATGGANQPGGTGTGDGGSGSGSGGAAATSSAKHGFPSYVAAIIGVLGAFGVIFLIVFFMRKRAVTKRAQRRQWWQGVMASGPPSNTDTWSARDSGDATAGNASSARSVRSSFGTTFDHSAYLPLTSTSTGANQFNFRRILHHV
jgi:hypothetical protein